jgi:membrane protease YdiL (CAAX protease family)
MSAVASNPACEPTAPPSKWTARLGALLEVACAFVVVHVAFRAIKRFTALGRLDVESGFNFTPGVVMILFTVALLLVCRRSFAVYGLTLAHWPKGAKVGVLSGALLIGGGGLLRVFTVGHRPGSVPPGLREGLIYGASAVLAVLILAICLRRMRRPLGHVSGAGWLALFAGFCVLPIVLGVHFGRPFVHELLSVLWLVIGAGFGEEIFYRGYLQSRLNEAFGRPLRWGGVQFGAGLIVASLLFGFLHVLNPVDYFAGRYDFAWGFGAATLGSGLIFGCLREATGSVLAGALAHSLLDVLARMQLLFS